jgi:hypothetical protein
MVEKEDSDKKINVEHTKTLISLRGARGRTKRDHPQ